MGASTGAPNGVATAYHRMPQ